MATTRLAVVGGGHRAHHLLQQVYAVRNREYQFAADDGWSIVGEAAYEKYARDAPAWTDGIADLEPEVTAVFDPDESALERIDRFCADEGDDPARFDTFDALAAAGSFDAAIVASPNFAHVAQATALLDRGIDTFCEKPIGLTLEEHDLLVEADDRSDALFYVGFNLRAHPLYTKIAELVSDGAIGDLGMITSHNVRVPFPPGFRYSARRSGGTLLEKNCHDFDLYNWYAGADPVRVAAIGGQRVLSQDTDALDHATVVVEYDDGVKATLELSLFSPFTQRRHRSYFLRGDDGLIRTPEEAGALDVYDRTTASRIQTRAHVADREGAVHGGADYRQMIRFLRCLRGEATRPASPTDAKKAAAIAVAAQESIEHGPFYRIDDDYDVEAA